MQEHKTIIGKMLDELEQIEAMEYISLETKHKAKQEILKNIGAYERGWQKERRRQDKCSI